MKEVRIIALLYSRPLRAISLILDQGNLGWAVLLAAGATWLTVVPFLSLLLMAIVFAPVATVIAAKLEGAVSVGIALERDFMPALVCCLMAWTAALLPLAALSLAFRWLSPPLHNDVFPSGLTPLLLWATVAEAAAVLYFLTLAVFSVRAIAGTSFLRASVAVATGVIAAAAALAVFFFARSFGFLFASPWVLYYLYLRFGAQVRGFSGGLGSRQRLRQLLETATVNSRDADAHYQLGLIYQQRRDWTQAKLHFNQAIQIDPSEVDAHYQLGRILRSEGSPQPALDQFQAAAAIDPKHSSSEVWREIGAAWLELQNYHLARQALHEYTNRRPFDPEGLYWYGVALARLGETQAAREAWETAREAVRTAPPHRRRKIRQWDGMAARELRRL